MWPSSAGKGKSRTGAAVLVLSSVDVQPVQPTNEHHRTSLRSCGSAEFSNSDEFNVHLIHVTPRMGIP